MQYYRNFRFLLAAVLIAGAPLAAQTFGVNPSSVTFQYSPNGPANFGQTLTVTGATTVAGRIFQNIDASGNPVNAPYPNSAAGLFVFNQPTSTTLAVGIDTGILSQLSTRGQANYNGTMYITPNGNADALSVPLQMQIGGNGQITVTAGGAAIPGSGLNMTASVGSTATTTVTVSTISNSPVQFNITTPTQAWLTISPMTGSVVSSTPVTLTLTANAAISGLNPLPANFTVATAIGSPSITVNLTIANGVTFSPSSLTFGYAINTQTYTPGTSQALLVSGLPTGTAFTATSNQSWLLINGSNSSGGLAGSTLSISVNAVALGNPPPVNTYTGQISLAANNGVTGSLQVTLNVTGTSNNTLNFSAASTSSPIPPGQSFTITGNGTFFATSRTNDGGSWISVTPNSGLLTNNTLTLSVTVDPSKVASAGNFSGTIQIFVSGVLTQTVFVSFTVGGTVTNGAIASPASLTFNVPPGGSAIQYVIVNSTTAFTVQSFGKGLAVTPLGGPGSATTLTVTVNANSPDINNVPGSYPGSIIIAAGSTTQTVTVNFTVAASSVIQSTPAGLGIIYQSDFTQNLTLTSTIDPPNGVGMAFTIAAPPGYVQISSNSGTTPATVAVRTVGTNLQPGFNAQGLTVTAPNAGNSPLTIPITILAPGSAAGLTLNPTSLSLTGVTGGTSVVQTVSVTGSSGAPVTATAASTGAWLSVTSSSQTIPATLTVTANPSTLLANPSTPYTGTITVNSNGSTVILNVQFTVNSTVTVTPALTVSSNSVTFNYKQGDNAPQPQTVQVNSSASTVSVTASASASWITASLSQSSTPATLTISVNPAQFGAGTQSGTVTVTGAGATGSPQSITVTLNVTSPPALKTDNTSLTFTYRSGDAPPPAQNVKVTSTGDPISFTVTVSNAPWLGVSPTSSSTPATLAFSVDISRLGVGTFPATVTLASSNSTQVINVLLIVSAPLPSISDVVNAGSLQDGPLAAGEVIVITGSAIGPDKPVTFNVTNGVLDKSLAGSVVKVGGYQAPMILASSTQVVAIVPYAIAGKLSTFVEVDFLGQSSNIITMQVAPSNPGLFTASTPGFPSPILNVDGTPNSADNPAAQGSTVTAVFTGAGQTNPVGVDGQLATDPGNLAVPAQAVSATINGEPTAAAASAVPNQASGVMAVTVQVPTDGTTGDLVVTVGTNPSQAGVTVFVR